MERYVHLRSVDDEYEHLESTLPSRARSGGAAAGVGGTPPAEEVESGPEANESRRHTDATENGGSGDVGGDVVGDGDVDVNGGGQRDNKVEPTVEDRACEGDDGQGGNDGAQSDTVRQGQRPEHGFSYESEDHTKSSPAVFVPLQEPAETFHQDDSAARSVNRCQHRRRNTRPGWGDAVDGAAAESYPSPSTPLPYHYHYRSPSCSPRLSPRPARSPYRQEGVGERVSTGRGEARQPRHSGQREEEMEEKNINASSRSDIGGGQGNGFPWPQVAGEEGHVGESSHAEEPRAWNNAGNEDPDTETPPQERENGDEDLNAGNGEVLGSSSGTRRASSTKAPTPHADSRGSRNTHKLASGVDDGHDCLPSIHEVLRENQQSKEHPETGSLCPSERRQSGGDVPEEGAFSADDDGHVKAHREGSIDFGEVGNGCGGSVVFFDNRDGEGERARGEDMEGGQEAWWQPESGSVLGGLAFSFERDTSSVVSATSEREVT